MSHRLVGTAGETRVSAILKEGRNLVGSDPHATVRIDESTVSRRHAEILVAEDQVEVRDLSSKNGTFVGTRKVAACRLHAGMAVTFGRVTLTLETVSENDIDLGLRLYDDPSAVLPGSTGGADSTVGLRPVELFVAQSLADLLTRAETGDGEAALAEAGVQALYSALPALRVTAFAREDPGVVAFVAAREGTGASGTARITADSDAYRLSVELPSRSMEEPYQPLVDAVAAILRIASGRARPAIERGEREIPRPSLPEPHSVVPSVQRIYREAIRVAGGDVGILVCGESGTGKEVLARFVHTASCRADGPFVALNCAALPTDLLEAELFGIERGVATGVDARPGKFELADGGTLFLDEIGDMALPIQAKLLRVLQEREVFRLGGPCAHAADCRIIAATNQEIDGLLRRGAFREDLYYRIATWVVELPALRYRRDDIPILAAHFLRQETERRGVRVRGISTAALEALRRYSWPGNIRQLHNEMKKAALFLTDGGVAGTAQLSPELLAGSDGKPASTLEETLARTERREILRALELAGGVAARAAEILGIGRSTLYRRMSALGVERAHER